MRENHGVEGDDSPIADLDQPAMAWIEIHPVTKEDIVTYPEATPNQLFAVRIALDPIGQPPAESGEHLL